MVRQALATVRFRTYFLLQLFISFLINLVLNSAFPLLQYVVFGQTFPSLWSWPSLSFDIILTAWLTGLMTWFFAAQFILNDFALEYPLVIDPATRPCHLPHWMRYLKGKLVGLMPTNKLPNHDYEKPLLCHLLSFLVTGNLIGIVACFTFGIAGILFGQFVLHDDMTVASYTTLKTSLACILGPIVAGIVCILVFVDDSADRGVKPDDVSVGGSSVDIESQYGGTSVQ